MTTDRDLAAADLATLTQAEYVEMLAAMAGALTLETLTFAICAPCEGTGEILSDHIDPQQVRTWVCDTCEGSGYVAEIVRLDSADPQADAPEWFRNAHNGVES